MNKIKVIRDEEQGFIDLNKVNFTTEVNRNPTSIHPKQLRETKSEEPCLFFEDSVPIDEKDIINKKIK